VFYDHLDEDVTAAMFASKLTIPETLSGAETAAPFIKFLDDKLQGADKDAFIDGFAAYLQADGSDRLANAADKVAMLRDTRKRLVATDLEITHRQIECAGTMSKTLAFDAQRRAYAGVARNDWGNFLINSTDVCDYLNADNGKRVVADNALRGQARPLDPSLTLDLRVSMDVQIELEYADPYLQSIDKAAKAIAVPLFMEWAQTQAGSGVDVANKQTFGAFLSKNLPAEKPAPDDPQRAQKEAARAKFVSDFAAFVATRFPDVKVDEHLVASLVRDDRGGPVDSFSSANPGVSAQDAARLKDDLAGAKDVWNKMIEAQNVLGKLPGENMIRTIQRAARDAGVTLGTNVTWGVPAKSKDDHAVDLVVPA
jgi:hypothetical protein